MFAYFSSVRLFNVLFYSYLFATVLVVLSPNVRSYSFCQTAEYFLCAMYERMSLIRFAVCMSRMEMDKMWEKCPFKQNRKNYLFIRLRLYKNKFTSLQQSCCVSLWCFCSIFLSSIIVSVIFYMCVFFFSPYTSYNNVDRRYIFFVWILIYVRCANVWVHSNVLFNAKLERLLDMNPNCIEWHCLKDWGWMRFSFCCSLYRGLMGRRFAHFTSTLLMPRIYCLDSTLSICQ